MQHKLNAIAGGVADLMKQLAKEHPELDTDLKDCDSLSDSDSKITKARPEQHFPRRWIQHPGSSSIFVWNAPRRERNLFSDCEGYRSVRSS